MARAPPLQPATRAGLAREDLVCLPASKADLHHPHPKFYFEDERIACFPREQTAQLRLHVDPFEEIKEWVAKGARNSKPGFIWLRSPSIVEPVELSADGKRMKWSKGECFFEVVPKIASNRSYYNQSSIDYLTGRPLRVRGRYDGALRLPLLPQLFAHDAHLYAHSLALASLSGSFCLLHQTASLTHRAHREAPHLRVRLHLAYRLGAARRPPASRRAHLPRGLPLHA